MAFRPATNDRRVAQLADDFLGCVAEHPLSGTRPGPYALSLVGDVQAVCCGEPPQPRLVDERRIVEVQESPTERSAPWLEEEILSPG
jgi:hypothetical protein